MKISINHYLFWDLVINLVKVKTLIRLKIVAVYLIINLVLFKKVRLEIKGNLMRLKFRAFSKMK